MIENVAGYYREVIVTQFTRTATTLCHRYNIPGSVKNLKDTLNSTLLQTSLRNDLINREFLMMAHVNGHPSQVFR